MSKYCSYCSKFIDENNPSIIWAMIITKKGPKIIQFDCFHINCWKEFFNRSIDLEINMKN